jgi:hypothetical protein
VPFNNFDALLADVRAVQKLRDTGLFQKALAQAEEERIVKAFPSVAELRAQRQAASKPVMLQELVPHHAIRSQDREVETLWPTPSQFSRLHRAP